MTNDLVQIKTRKQLPKGFRDVYELLDIKLQAMVKRALRENGVEVFDNHIDKVQDRIDEVGDQTGALDGTLAHYEEEADRHIDEAARYRQSADDFLLQAAEFKEAAMLHLSDREVSKLPRDKRRPTQMARRKYQSLKTRAAGELAKAQAEEHAADRTDKSNEELAYSVAMMSAMVQAMETQLVIFKAQRDELAALFQLVKTERAAVGAIKSVRQLCRLAGRDSKGYLGNMRLRANQLKGVLMFNIEGMQSETRTTLPGQINAELEERERALLTDGG